MVGLVLLAHVAALAVFAGFTQWEASKNAQMIRANGAANDLQAGFHERRTWIRLWWWAACTLGAALVVALRSLPLAVVTLLALGILLGGYFLRTFSPQLNVKMGLIYKKRFYASRFGQTFPDKQVWAATRQNHPGQPDDALQDEADALNHRLLNYAGLACLLLYAGLLGVGWWWWG